MGSRIDNTIAIIPSFNESRTIGSVVNETISMGLKVLVVDDGSSDNTARVAMDNGALVIGHSQNKGKGAAVREGMRYVLENTNFEWMVIMDGDGQHHPADIPFLMQATTAPDVDLVIGNRMLQTRDMPKARYWTNRFTSWVVSGICGEKIPDTQCGFRLLRSDAVKNMTLTTDKYDIESEILIQAAESNHHIRSVPIRTIYGEEVSAIKPIRDTFKFFKLVLKYHFFNKRPRS